MKIGTTIRNMGQAATTARIAECADLAEEADLAHIWVVDHIAIPPDDAEGSDGRWLDPLPVLAYLAARTTHIEIGVSVLVLPYRPPLPTAKWIATIQELSGGRLHFGVGVGWMAAEFRALGISRAKRGEITDHTLEVIKDCFAADDDLVTANGQTFLFRPRPTRPLIHVGGMGEAALRRAIRYGDGWLPMGLDPVRLEPKIRRLEALAAAAGKSMPRVLLLGSLPDTQEEAVDKLGACAALGVTDFIQSSRYTNADEFAAIIERLGDIRRQLA